MNSEGYTGHLYEEEVLGVCKVACGYVSWRAAAVLAIRNQPAKKTPTVACLEREVEKQLGRPVKFFTAVRSPMDLFHGVDGFFGCEDKILTVDLTMNPHKDHGKANLIIHKDELSEISVLASRIASEIRSRLPRRM